MLYQLETKDIKLTPLMQTAFDNYFNNSYTNAFDALTTIRQNKESIRGFSKDYTGEAFHFLAFMLGALIYYESSRGVNTSYDYFDTKYNFDTIRDKLACFNIELSQVFAAFELFTGEVLYPSDVVGGVTYIYYGSGNTAFYDETHNLIYGRNLITHNLDGDVGSLTIFINGMSQTFGWSDTDSLVVDASNQVVVYSPGNYNNVRIKMVINKT